MTNFRFTLSSESVNGPCADSDIFFCFFLLSVRVYRMGRLIDDKKIDLNLQSFCDAFSDKILYSKLDWIKVNR